MMLRIARTFVRFACVTTLLAGTAHAQDAHTLRVRSLAATCAPCHGTDGHAVAGAALPGLAGMPAGYFTEQMTGFKSGARPATMMTHLARGFSDAQIEQMARFFAAQRK